MQKPIKRGNSWRITVRHNGQRYNATRDTQEECIKWAKLKLIELQTRDAVSKEQLIHLTFKELFEKYYADVGSKMRGYVFIKQQLGSFEKYWGKLAHQSIHEITPQKITKWRNDRLKEVSPGTVQRQMCLYSSVFTYAVRELFLLKQNPFSLVQKPTKPAARSRLISDDEIDDILLGLGYSHGMRPFLPSHYVGWAFIFAMETAMRRGEIIRITRDNIHEDHIHLPMTKNGSARDVPLSKRAKELLSLVPDNGNKLIPHNDNSFRLLWERNLRRVGLNGMVHFHDTRHVAITRLVNNQKLPVEILAKVTGHKTINTLINTYYNPKPSDIARMLDA
ncbi:site-specific integrase [Acinetobacter indicus]|uniref:tyrosine-type recombinase/integrase n=1 Tax=Acinetobacter indicus TaxID=756892 RepID=UPI0012663371|nr:site-specific integrase [Acinetobacter indicus]QFS18705.1 site-specific integrase [Acinetobacter indicus]